MNEAARGILKELGFVDAKEADGTPVLRWGFPDRAWVETHIPQFLKHWTSFDFEKRLCDEKGRVKVPETMWLKWVKWNEYDAFKPLAMIDWEIEEVKEGEEDQIGKGEIEGVVEEAP